MVGHAQSQEDGSLTEPASPEKPVITVGKAPTGLQLTLLTSTLLAGSTTPLTSLLRYCSLHSVGKLRASGR